MYYHNGKILVLSSLWLPLILCAFIGLGTYIFFFLLFGKKELSSSNGSIMFLTIFFLYGPIIDQLIKWDLFGVYHFTLLPALIIFGIYIAYLVSKLKQQPTILFSNFLIFLVGLLFLYNSIGIGLLEWDNIAAIKNIDQSMGSVSRNANITSSRDIYYIVLDEFAGLDVARDYWKYPKINEFENFLSDNGFFVSQDSRSTTDNSLKEIAERLNWRDYHDVSDINVLYYLISENHTMALLKSLGYTTIAFDQMRSELYYPAKTPIIADYNLHHPDSDEGNSVFQVDSFTVMVFNNTMLRPFTEISDIEDLYGPTVKRHINEVLYSFDTIGKLDDIPSPKFIYAHLMIPHEPWVFNADGTINDSSCFLNWECYFETYLFSIQKTQDLVRDLLANSNPDNLPIIILQSDHGARNTLTNGSQLKGYSKEYKYHILNALFLPGMDNSLLQNNMKPINTFPLIFNHYFGYYFPMQ